MSITDNISALTQALILAVTAPTEEQSDRATARAFQLSGSMPVDEVIVAKSRAEQFLEFGPDRTDRCAICAEVITSVDAIHWTHAHSADVYCGTGDGSFAYPASGNGSGRGDWDGYETRDCDCGHPPAEHESDPSGCAGSPCWHGDSTDNNGYPVNRCPCKDYSPR